MILEDDHEDGRLNAEMLPPETSYEIRVPELIYFLADLSQ